MSLVPSLSLITVAFSSFNVGWVRKWTLLGGLPTGTFTSTVLRLTVSFDSFRNVARSSKMAEGSLSGTTLRSGFFASSAMFSSVCQSLGIPKSLHQAVSEQTIADRADIDVFDHVERRLGCNRTAQVQQPRRLAIAVVEEQPGASAHLREHVLGIAVLVIEAARLVAAAVFMDVDADAVHGHAQVGKRDVGKTAQRAPAHGLEADTAQDRLAAHGDALRRNGGMAAVGRRLDPVERDG